MNDKNLIEHQAVEAELVVDDIHTQQTHSRDSSQQGRNFSGTAIAVDKSRSSLGMYLLAFWVVLLTFASAAVAFWLYHERVAQQMDINKLQSELQMQTQLLQDAQQRQQENLDRELIAQQDALGVHITSLNDEIKKVSTRVTTLSNINTDTWKVSEAQFLLRLANQRILLEKDSQNALALALSADNILREVNQNDMTQVRRTLAEEISVLKMVGIVDREGIFLRLAALANQIDAIPFVQPLGSEFNEDDTPAIPENETWTQKINRYFYTGLHKFNAYIRVRDHGKNVNAILPPSQQMYLQQNLRLMLEQAQVALLRNDAQIFRESLVKAQNWINQYYALNQEAVTVLAELESLQLEDVAPELTNFSNSSNALMEYVEQRQKQAAIREEGQL